MKKTDRILQARACAIALPLLVGVAQGQVVRDGSLGRGPAALSGPDITISPRHGQQVGANLFHSFSRFDVPAGQRATFTGPNSVRNVLARVTSGASSRIDGTIASSIPKASLFLMNPQGVIFGPDARLEITGSFAAVSSDSIGLGREAGVFPADPAARQVLSAQPPTSFGFLGPRAGGIRVNGARLAVETGRELTLIGSGVQPKGEEPHGVVLQSAGRVTGRNQRLIGAQLVAPDGRVDLIAVNGSGRVERILVEGGPQGVKTAALDSRGLSGMGDILLAQRSQVSVDGGAAGLVFARGNAMSIRDSIITAVTTGA
ncbi:MAG: filamentous hemagglutinin N-terminal domain-containing protein, partial [Phycisphaerae bacterium]|nr:filamentous hemagglutinin N-terminal domain-containing protein [Phycisphaerae bacterium]